MTMAVKSDKGNIDVSFTNASITPRHYMGTGPSGWPETYDRKKLDAKLDALVKPLTMADLLELFALQRRSRARGEAVNHHTIRGFLCRALNLSPTVVTPDLVLGFWCRTILDEQATAEGAN